MDLLIAYLNSIFPLSEELKIHLRKIIKRRTIERKAYLLKIGDISSQVCFIESGLLRCFYEKNGNEVSSWFMKENDVVFSIDSFYSQSPSYEAIQALEHTTIFFITFDELAYIYNKYIEFNFVGRVLTIFYHKLWGEQLYSIRMRSGEERYEWLLTKHPELTIRVPAKYLSSYLDISEFTLSKIKARHSHPKIDN
ncbi:cyclic nucleotide-binding domain-containing protein [Paraflavitalea sp. CAU 1676]|uniref:Crp/Fnr family transcriptional regulator n=1 Tax=Paraflavitalea sp. CAU 1676 TaxID=3032598 RepID=UPI0023DAD992|nr:cyclic nucleotide-binding domain-containing protein [Paraflavitalea sp. CAU 1676]MDF2191393.1 cyclic nucleotide-binding domain-containing protein [Paraflavitalea sp. CAU 1676]